MARTKLTPVGERTIASERSFSHSMAGTKLTPGYESTIVIEGSFSHSMAGTKLTPSMNHPTLHNVFFIFQGWPSQPTPPPTTLERTIRIKRERVLRPEENPSVKEKKQPPKSRGGTPPQHFGGGSHSERDGGGTPPPSLSGFSHLRRGFFGLRPLPSFATLFRGSMRGCSLLVRPARLF